MASNIEYLNGVRNLASQIYQDRIPVATKENLAEVTQAILEYPNNRNEFIEVLQEHMEKDGLTVFYSTHITSDLDKVGDYLVFIYKGKIILNGDKESILENHKIIRGSKELLDDDTKKYFISYQENSFGFDGLTFNYKTAYEIFGEEVVYDKANLEDIIMYYTRG